jgi:hypothetical protein
LSFVTLSHAGLRASSGLIPRPNPFFDGSFPVLLATLPFAALSILFYLAGREVVFASKLHALDWRDAPVASL